MSLTDTDKSSLDRGAPQTNSSDVLNSESVKAHKTISTHYATDADTGTGVLQMQNKSIIGNAGGVPITLYGYNPALQIWGLFVTQPGVNVITNTDLSKFIFNSNQQVLKIASSGIVTITKAANSGFNSLTVAHGLSSTPVVMSYLSAGRLYPLPHLFTTFATAVANGTVNSILDVYTDTTNIVFSIQSMTTADYASTYSWDIFYYIVQNFTLNYTPDNGK